MSAKRLSLSLALAIILVVLALLSLRGWGCPAHAQEPPAQKTTGSVAIAGNGDQWTPLNGPWAAGGKPTALAVNPHIPNTAYAVVDSFHGGGHLRLYATTDGGDNWTEKYVVPPGQPILGGSQPIYSLVFTRNRVIYGTTGCLEAGFCNKVTADGGASIYRSTDGGTSFTPVYTSLLGLRHDVVQLAQNPVTSTILFAAGAEGAAGLLRPTILRSTDDGLHWSRVYSAPLGGSVDAVAISPFTPTLVIMGENRHPENQYHLYRSADNGATWSQVYTIPDASPVAELGFDPADSSRVYAAANNCGFYRSTDSGLNWTRVASDTARRFVVTTETTPTIIATCGTQFYTSTNAITWYQTSDASPGVLALALAPGNVVWAGIDAVGTYRSTDKSLSWTPAYTGIESLVPVNDIALSPFDPQTLYVIPGIQSQAQIGARQSINGGLDWSALFPDPAALWGAVTPHPADANILLAGDGANIRRTTNGGAAWPLVFDIRALYPTWDYAGAVRDLRFHPEDPQLLYAVGVNNPTNGIPWESYILRSTQGGGSGSWTRLLTRTIDCAGFDACGFTSIGFDPHNPQTVFVSGGQGDFHTAGEGVVYRTTTGGATWTAVLTHPREIIRAVAVAPWNPNYVYAATSGPNANTPGDNTTIYRSTDGGQNWDQVQVNFRGNRLMADPAVPNRLFVSSPYSAGVSFDAGQTFMALSEPDEFPATRTGDALAIRRGELTQTLYFGSLGLWRKSIDNFEILQPGPGSQLTSRDKVLTLDVAFSMSLTYTPLITPTRNVSGYTYAGIVFDLEADAQTQSQIQTKPATLTLSYATAFLPDGVNEEALRLYRWDEDDNAWRLMTELNRNVTQKTVTIRLNHLSQFALLTGGEQKFIYLPILFKNN
jgi:photosystem II stability/assembly factor-like uncharacterized protein